MKNNDKPTFAMMLIAFVLLIFAVIAHFI